ncbi:tRNA-dihydrouridine synthase 3 [Saxophila tyrrhenica]|uniref:tRNA-dihydrouridine(47) synthase [NAD(P)(+)] n=1 Tax=Saxophila tyrrhenica TaxID=1690608 RepID=A0AAV9PCP9_9PEZI|nr:tRNA-dihydrouridine synthase 3 [Saxophila tyrrhenica]
MAADEVPAMPPSSSDQANGHTEAKHRQRDEQNSGGDVQESPRKRVKLDPDTTSTTDEGQSKTDGEPRSDRQKGIAPIKKEFLVDISTLDPTAQQADDDAAEASGRGHEDKLAAGRGGKKTQGGQNHARQYGQSRDAIQLCKSRSLANEFDELNCSFGTKCKWEHDIRKYLKDGKREDLSTFDGVCPIYEVRGKCLAGWRCRFAGSHSKEVEHEDGRKELVQTQKDVGQDFGAAKDADEEEGVGVGNVVSIGDKINLRKRKFPLPKSDGYLQYLERKRNNGSENAKAPPVKAEPTMKTEDEETNGVHDARASYTEPPLKPSEKRRIYYGAETPVLAPLTTQGNLPFRRLCVSLGAEVTWSEMAMGFPLIQGEKQEWALVKCHESELAPPKYTPKGVVQNYDNAKDLKFGAQIAANKPYIALKTTEVLTALCPHLRAIDLNCGCPIDLVYKQGAGSALLDARSKLENILRGMNVVSGEVPITVKIRTGVKDKQPTAEKLCRRLVLGGEEAQDSGEGPSGVAAITLHGRSRQQRYTRSADWEYIAECANLVQNLRSDRAEVTDTVREPDARDLSASAKPDGLPYFIGNGDILSHVDYNQHMAEGKVDSCMIARGALIKPWIFEEIATNQYLDKSASERLGYIERFARNGLEYWGSDEIGVGTTRRFLLEWLSFSCRYVPVGILEHLPPRLGDRPPAFKGRSDLETLLSSANYKDWIKISEMFLGPTHKDFHFQPKHKSNSYEIEAEG